MHPGEMPIRPGHAAGRGDERSPNAAGNRTVALGGGQVLNVRSIRRGDAPKLGRLYENLSLEDRYHRFFSVYQPSCDVLDHMASVGEESGCGLVAVVTDPSGEEEIVGEASCTGLPNGNGEFGITIASSWRGWLGPFLLDALVEAAAARGVPNLEADIMMENTKMLALVRARGCVTVARPDRGIIRVAIGAARPVDANPAGLRMPRSAASRYGGRATS